MRRRLLRMVIAHGDRATGCAWRSRMVIAPLAAHGDRAAGCVAKARSAALAFALTCFLALKKDPTLLVAGELVVPYLSLRGFGR